MQDPKQDPDPEQYEKSDPDRKNHIGSTTLLETVENENISPRNLGDIKKNPLLTARITPSLSPVSFTLLVEVLYSLQAQVSAPGGQNHHILLSSQFHLVG
jgi:hypothetical protein